MTDFAPYGMHLPIFPTFYAWTEEAQERAIERLMDRADRCLMRGDATQDQYDRWCEALDAWATSDARRV